MVAGKVAPLLVIVGETASGKSALALHLAQLFCGEIICADAWTVRRGADIGTAKPSIADQEKIPHYLLDIIEPYDKFNASDFKTKANKAIDEINGRGKLPILVGGSGLYVDGVVFDYGFLPSAEYKDRNCLNRMEPDELIEVAKQKSLNIESVDRKNKRRLVRLIETGGAQPTRNELRDNTLIIGLKISREDLRQRVNKRVEQMLAAGLENEVFVLSREYGWGCEALKGIGYKEWQEYFEGNISKQEVGERIIKNTLYLAKRQRTWFKRNKSIHWYSTPVNLGEVVDIVTTQLLFKVSR